MSIYSTLLVTGPIQDGFILPVDHCAFSKLNIGSATAMQLVFSIEGSLVHSLTLVNSSLMELTPSSVVSVEKASNVAVRLINPTNPKQLDVLILVNGSMSGVYQYVSNVWAYRGTIQLVPFNTSAVKATSVGSRSNLPFVGGVCSVTVTSTIPQVMLPYTIYVDKSNGLVYFPYFTAATYQYPVTVASIWSPSIADLLYEEQLVIVSPCGYKQRESLPVSTEYVHLTYTSLLNASIHQPIAYHNSLLEVVHNTVITPTNHQVDYSVIQGLSDTDYQLTNGNYKGGNNLWDTVISAHSMLNSSRLTEIVPTSTYTSAIVDLQLSQLSPGSNRTVSIYIGKSTEISAANIAYRVNLVMFTSNRISNIRLAAGESIHIKVSSALSHFTYRYTMLARTF
jgi:hypothetical protein